jgi:hypothetical protein
MLGSASRGFCSARKGQSVGRHVRRLLLVQTISALEVRAYFRFDGSRVCSSYGAEQVPASRPCLQHARSEQTAATVTVSVPEKSGRLAAERSPTSAPRPERARVDAASRRSREAEARRRPSGDSGMVFRMEAEAASEAPGGVDARLFRADDFIIVVVGEGLRVGVLNLVV